MSLLQEAKKRLIGKVIKFGSPGYPMKCKPKSIVIKGQSFLVDYELYNDWATNKWESGHYFVITKSKMQTLLAKGTVGYKAKDGAFIDIIL